MDDFFDLPLSQPSTTHGNISSENYKREALRLEREDFLQRCGSCLNFSPFISEAGFCKIDNCNCICNNPKAMIDIWDNKCGKWIVNPIYLFSDNNSNCDQIFEQASKIDDYEFNIHQHWDDDSIRTGFDSKPIGGFGD